MANLVVILPISHDHIIPLVHTAALNPQTFSYGSGNKLGAVSPSEQQSRKDDREVGIAQILAQYLVRRDQ